MRHEGKSKFFPRLLRYILKNGFLSMSLRSSAVLFAFDGSLMRANNREMLVSCMSSATNSVSDRRHMWADFLFFFCCEAWHFDVSLPRWCFLCQSSKDTPICRRTHDFLAGSMRLRDCKVNFSRWTLFWVIVGFQNCTPMCLHQGNIYWPKDCFCCTMSHRQDVCLYYIR